jgi:hypothetical protein
MRPFDMYRIDLIQDTILDLTIFSVSWEEDALPGKIISILKTVR